jgi:pimeloyl-ACP methyl ester carboxylesterase
VSTPRALRLPDQVRRVKVRNARGTFAALEAQPARGVCERRPALLLPGFTGSKEDFLSVLQSLAGAGRRVVALDLRGQYQSPGAAGPGGYATEELAADVAAVAGSLAASAADDDQGVHLLGHSFGGLIARQAVLSWPGRVLSLTLLCSGPASIGGQRAAMLRSVLSLLGEPEHTRLDELRAQVRMLWDAQLGPQAEADGTPARILAFLRERTLRSCPVGYIVMGQTLLDCPDRTAELARLARRDGPPILVLYGENDDAWPPRVQESMARTLDAQRVCIPGAAHSPAVEAPEATAQALTGFWNAAECARRRRSYPDPAASSPAASSPAASSPAASSVASAAAAGEASPSQGRRGSAAALPSGQ